MGKHTSYTSSSGKKKSLGREALSWALCLGCAVLIALLLRTFVFELVMVDGESMEPTLHSYENVFVEKVSRLFGNIERRQIIIVRYPGLEGAFVKRVVGLPGDRVAVRDGKLHVNGEAWDEAYINTNYIDYEMEEITVPEKCYFVMGDNRNESMDSHSANVGPIPEENIIGHALFVIWPLSDIKGLG